MIQVGTRKRLLIDAFIIAAIAVVAINIYLLTDLIGSTIAQKSEAFKMASSKWNQYKQIQDQTLDDLVKSAEELIAIARMGRRAEPEKTELTASSQENQGEGQKASGLPVLSGILQIAGAGERSRFIALMEGKRLYENDKIMNFTIKNITSKGVLLSQKGQTKFIPAPEVYFSLGGELTPNVAKSR
ncbi:MAG: hypothetical protein FP814_07180 [Desulfobacterium sp.]|nr:hypothetical protein [Desulfobacterium sp.]MBU3948641.1 hypothetical protein [Pseudomonadota bacterium]MBU4010332.1 hypothetical protein [Pseudomonadota bacterium]MBU4037997.1 hypothetical protein [Pseudomonadota bacterium]